MTQLEQAEQWLKAMRKALDDQDRSRCMELDDINQNSQIDWDLMSDDLSSRYDEISDEYVQLVIYS